MNESNKSKGVEERLEQSSEELFAKYCRECGKDKDDIRATSWHAAGMIDYTFWLLHETGQFNSLSHLKEAEGVPRWVKATERLPDMGSRQCLKILGVQGYGWFFRIDEGKYACNYTSFNGHGTIVQMQFVEVEWLEESAQPSEQSALKDGEQLADDITNIMYDNISDEADDGSWIESKDFYKVARVIVSELFATPSQAEEESKQIRWGTIMDGNKVFHPHAHSMGYFKTLKEAQEWCDKMNDNGTVDNTPRCSVCFVPKSQHGTACGWGNATRPIEEVCGGDTWAVLQPTPSLEDGEKKMCITELRRLIRHYDKEEISMSRFLEAINSKPLPENWQPPSPSIDK